jgi:trimeric autotransporter adhesin
MRTFPRMRSLALVLLSLAVTMPADAQQRVGVNAAVNTDAIGTPPGGATRRLIIGQEVVHNEHITTDAKGQAQILFLDGSSVSVGPQADLLIDDFVYDPATSTGKITLTQLQGAMRFVGGKLSKEEDAVNVHLGTTTIGVRGGVFFADIQRGGKSEVIFVYGKAIRVTGANGSSEELYRPGFAVDIDPAGTISSPHPAPPGATAGILAQLDGRAGSTGGATTVPTNATVANSGLPNVVSNAVASSVQAAVQNSASATPSSYTPAPAASVPQVPQNQIQVASSQTQPFVASPPAPTPTSSPTAPPQPVVVNPPTAVPTPAPVPTPGPAPAPAPAPAPQPVVVQIAGLVKIAPKGSTLGFTDQSASGRVPYTGSITYPAGSGMQDGVATGVDSVGTVLTVSPLTAGATTNVTATASTTQGQATGTVTTSADGNFFYGNLTATGSGQQVFVMGGTPVVQSFYSPQPTTQLLAFQLQPDFTLANGSQAQTIPFLPSFAGGTQPNAVVSPFYVVNAANTAFGSFNPLNNPNGSAARGLQASLAINGQGASQSAAFEVATASFSTSTTFGSVMITGPMRGVFMPGGTSPLVHAGSGFTTVPDANGNNLFGGNTIDGFVLDQNQSDANNNLVLASANAFQVGVANSTVDYAFNQPAVATALPSGVGTNRSALSEQGFFGGIMETGGRFQYALMGANAVITNPTSNEVGAFFVGSDPFTSTTTGVSAAEIPFATLSATGRNFARSTFIDNNIYAATESYNSAVQVITPSGSTITYPTESGGATTFPTAAMVTSGTVPGAANGLFQAAGATPCACQYLQWGYWEANLPTTNQGGPSNTTQASYINTWVAGQPTVTMPTSGTGTYSGAAIGTVANAGAAYLAAGGFTNTYNFANSTGTIAINNFDGRNFRGSVAGSGNLYAGNLSGSNLSGTAAGMFYGPNAAETGGSFAVRAGSGPSYIASGIFAGKLTGPIH